MTDLLVTAVVLALTWRMGYDVVVAVMELITRD